ncbi:hypothetical protein M378DRAFT_167739 [Amanita muscaria Koide BX008]|uniref:Uncharacterized protein n=1 Tax=Amanita muscaria (strain Koide BX008) TaxID=946122 RepID=A0A0C2WH08_AMAMK|nr:hypothetical protein M378DRAFT_167739 [Amanita muscaria Koide BX008]
MHSEVESFPIHLSVQVIWQLLNMLSCLLYTEITPDCMRMWSFGPTVQGICLIVSFPAFLHGCPLSVSYQNHYTEYSFTLDTDNMKNTIILGS